MNKDRKLEQNARRKGLRFIGNCFEYASDMLCDEQQRYKKAESEKAARRKKFEEKQEAFEREWQRRNPTGM